jgi:DegV family protein with EDD domain
VVKFLLDGFPSSKECGVSIKIVSDSTCDLPQEIVTQYDITIVPLYINIGDRGYLDGVEITRQEFYEGLPNYDPLPTTATPGIDAFRMVYDQLDEDGATEVLSIHISISLSSTVDVARAAAQETSSVPVTVFDSQQLSLGTGFLVLAAAKAAAEGSSMDEIIALLKEQTSRTYVFAALDTLEFLQRSGRMNSVVARLGSLLQIKPLLTMHGGEPTGERVRTRERAIARLIQMVSDLGSLEKIALVHTNAPEAAQDLYQRARHLFPEEGTPLSVDVTPTLGANIGPGVIGFTCITAGKSSKNFNT